MGLKADVAADVRRVTNLPGARGLVSAFRASPGFRFLLAHRLVESTRHRVGLSRVASRTLRNHYRYAYGFDIPETVVFGPGAKIVHFGMLVLHKNVVIGSNVTLTHGVTIGAIQSGPRQGVPTIEDDVWIGANAVVAGGITIGRGARVAPGAFVNFDVPAGALVIGNPGKIVDK